MGKTSNTLSLMPVIFLTGFLLFGVCFAVEGKGAGEVGTEGEWFNSLKPAGAEGGELVLASGGETGYRILLPCKASSQEVKAGADLARWLGEMTGARFEVIRQCEGFEPSGKEISIGWTRLAGEVLGEVDIEALGDEGYRIAVEEQRAFLLGGKTRGIINAVYALLEEDLGCRWYTKDSQRIPKRSDLRVRVAERCFVPVLEMRDPFFFGAFDEDWSLRNRTNAPRAVVREEWGGHINHPDEWFAHTFEQLVPSDEYFDEHPEYYALKGGRRTRMQICPSERACLRIAKKNFLKAIDDYPDAELFSISQNDNQEFCDCPCCRALNEREGSYAAAVIKFVNELAKAAEAKRPGIKVSTLAYQGTFAPPKTVRPRDNVVVYLCTDNHSWVRPYLFVTETSKFQQALKGWAKAGAKMHIWDYTVEFADYLAVVPNLPVVSNNMRFYLEHNARGVMLQGAYQSAGGDLAELKTWVWAKQLWDSSRETDELVKDFVYGYYGNAADAVMGYVELRRRAWEMYHGSPRRGRNVPLGGRFYDMAWEFFGKAEAAAKGDDELLRRVELAFLPILFKRVDGGYVKLCRGGSVGDMGEYRELVDRFERICRRERVDYLRESPQPNFDNYIRQVRSRLGEDEDGNGNKGDDGGQVKVNVSDGAVVIKPGPKWRFITDEADVGVNEKWFAVGFDDGEWVTARTDGNVGWEGQGFGMYDGFGWYRKTIELDDESAGRNVYMYFGAVDEEAYIYINGAEAFEHSCESTGLANYAIWNKAFFFDASGMLKSGENQVTVRVYDSAGMGGIWKPVYFVCSEYQLGFEQVRQLVNSVY
jgi:hypothetical protein